MTSTLELMILQTPADLGMPSDRLAWLRAWLDEANLTDIDLILLPELFQTGYNAADTIPDIAETSNGMFFQSMAELARRYQLAIAYGYAERMHNRIYNSAQVIDAMGNSIANHRKLAIPPGFESALFDKGQHMTQFSLKGVEVGMLICFDAEFPEYMRIMALAGAELVLVPTALSDQWAVVAERVIPARAFENGIHVAYANHCGIDKGLRFLGKSCIISPTGVDLARADSGGDALAIQASISRNIVKAAQARLPYLKECKTLSL